MPCSISFSSEVGAQSNVSLGEQALEPGFTRTYTPFRVPGVT